VLFDALLRSNMEQQHDFEFVVLLQSNNFDLRFSTMLGRSVSYSLTGVDEADADPFR